MRHIQNYMSKHPGKFTADFLNIKGTMHARYAKFTGRTISKWAKGTGSWNWTRNKRFGLAGVGRQAGRQQPYRHFEESYSASKGPSRPPDSGKGALCARTSLAMVGRKVGTGSGLSIV